MQAMLTSIVISALVICCYSKDFFASYKQMEDLMDLQKIVLDHAKQVALDEHNKIAQLHELLRKLEAEINNISDRQIYAGNPINQLFIVKLLTKDKTQLQNYIGHNVEEKEFNFPDESDYTGVIEGIYRLQDTYDLLPIQLGMGNLSEKYRNRPLTAAEYFEIGFHAYSISDFYHALQWFMASEEQLKHETLSTIERSKILDYLSFTTYKQGNIGHALNLTKELLHGDPKHERAILNEGFFEDELKTIRSQNARNVYRSFHQIENERDEETFPEKRTYENLCHGVGLMSDEKRLSKLECRYRHNNKPWLRFQPIKEEEIFDEPKIVMYHEVVNDEEIEILKRISEPYLQRALIHNPQTSQLEPAKYRISKLCWLKESDHPVVARLSDMMRDLMNISVSSAEMLQVQNYGVGGHYEPHYDFSRVLYLGWTNGNRVATWLTYLTDVEMGGSTVFTPIGARVTARKGSAVTWFNMFRSGQGDYRTRHASCPVLFGTKWVANRWLHEHGQEFIRGCSTDPML